MTPPIVLPSDYEQLQPWFDVIRHFNTVVMIAKGSAQWVEIGVYVDEEGRPQQWTRPERRVLNPKNREVRIAD